LASPFKDTRRSMKKLNWDTIPSQRIMGKLNVWTTKRTQRDLVLDIRSMEELFSQVEKRASFRSSRASVRKNCEGIDLCLQEPQVNLKKKITGFSIANKTFPIFMYVSHTHFVILQVKQLLSFTGNISLLPEADQFMVQLVKVPGYQERLKTMMLREEFFPLMEEVKNSVDILTKAANELLDCDDLHSVIRLVLKAGNYMNAGGFSANAIGFRMTSLLNLADTKANKPGMNLMHYVAKQAEDIDVELLTFPSQLEHIGMASRICKDEVITEFEREVKKIKEVKLYSSREPDLLQQMETFLKRADAKVADVQRTLQELDGVSGAVAEFFCEDPATFKLEECCSIFHSFCKRFDTAVQENREREAAEQRRKHRESVRVSPKRHRTQTSHHPEPDEDSSSLESALHTFLSNIPEGISRCRRMPSATVSPAVTSLYTRQERPENKQPKLQDENQQIIAQENKEEAEKMRAITRKVLRYQNSQSSLDGRRVSGTPRRLERCEDSSSTPDTPQPRARDYFFAHNGGVSSPWTILSPVICSRRNTPQQRRQTPKQRLSMTFGGDDTNDGVWESYEGNCLSNCAIQDSVTCPSRGSASLPDCPGHRSASHGPVLRSVSMDETRRPSSPASNFWLGELFQRSRISKMGNYLEGQTSSGIISFFKRIGGKSKPGDVEEQLLKGSNT
uniref:FH2 domain containing 3 n=1 Tax=Sphaeramia orbicularis TaxID=375764 RepID=A0A673B689_9TELE